MKPRKSGKHSRGHGKPKKQTPVHLALSAAPVKRHIEPIKILKTDSELQVLVKLGVALERLGYKTIPDWDE